MESTILDAHKRGNSIMIEKKKQFTLDIKKRYIVK